MMGRHVLCDGEVVYCVMGRVVYCVMGRVVLIVLCDGGRLSI